MGDAILHIHHIAGLKHISNEILEVLFGILVVLSRALANCAQVTGGIVFTRFACSFIYIVFPCIFRRIK